MYKTTRASYKQESGPAFAYPWAYDVYEKQKQQHWLPEEVKLHDDVSCWKNDLSDDERHLLTQVQLYLANADCDIADVYVSKYLPNLPLPEVRAMLLTIAAMEVIHQQAYALTIDTLGLPQKSYSAFLEIPEMWEKHKFVVGQRTENLTEVQKFLLDIAIGSAFGEGLQLFSAFAIILSFQRRGMMNGLCQLTKYIATDEDLHTGAMSMVFNTIIEEYPEANTAELRQHISAAAIEAVRLEDHFIDLSFGTSSLPNMTPEVVKKYIRYIANKRLGGLNLPQVFEQKDNPLPWIDEMICANEHANFFEVRSTAYSKGSLVGNWGNVWPALTEKLAKLTESHAMVMAR